MRRRSRGFRVQTVSRKSDSECIRVKIPSTKREARPLRAGSGLIGIALGRAGVRAIAAIPCRASGDRFALHNSCVRNNPSKRP